ncbi:MAG: glutamine--fructose-6-phosphate transaminase (isomerizing) [Clostridia bacterium]|nr:glutamine--fructose-6-phosphate transaminase (isomerizing) [Clostridia bacterium]
MCGIVGYVGIKKAAPILIDGLLKLEYRGYDSAGISTIEDNSLSLIKDKGRVKNILNIQGFNSLSGTTGIAHTRWATHGKPSRENSHPHFDNSSTFSVVHNGIIENYNELRDFLIGNGYLFISQTDTEIIPNLIHYYYSGIANNDFLQSVKLACNDLHGSFAIEVICKDFPDNIIVAKKDSPLVIGKGIDENYIASDIPAVLKYTKNFYFLNDNEFALLTKNSISFFDNELHEISKDIKIIDWDENSADKNGYEDYMLKEIYEQPDSIRKTINSRLLDNGNFDFSDLNFSKNYLNAISKIYIIACGTAMHAGLSVKNTIEKLCKISTEVDIASEFRYRSPLINKNTLCIFVSQSGETADTLAALKLCKENEAKTIAITNVQGSSITREADYCILTYAGPEIAVASTKAYTAQVTLLCMLAIYFAEVLGICDKNALSSLKQDIISLPTKLETTLNNCNLIKDFALKVYNEHDLFFLGRGIDYSIALEGSLKLKEISYIHSEAYAAGELKHGPIALIENDTTVITILTDKNLVKKSISNTQEVITRGAKTLIITNQNLPNYNFDTVVEIPEINEFISPVLAIVPLQLLAYYISKEKGLDVDKPRNLAKSVTVE